MSIFEMVASVTSIFSTVKPKRNEHYLLKRLREIGHSTDQLANSILAILVASVELSLGELAKVQIVCLMNRTSYRSYKHGKLVSGL